MLFSFTYLFNLQLDCPINWRIEVGLSDGDKKDAKGVAKERIASFHLYKEEPIDLSATKPWLADFEVSLFPWSNSISKPPQVKGREDSISLTL
jgi:hypothetical protein